MTLAWKTVDGLDPLAFLWLAVVTLVGGSLAAGAANAINCYLDRDIDELMVRTRRRPLPAHAVSPEDALVFVGDGEEKNRMLAGFPVSPLLKRGPKIHN